VRSELDSADPDVIRTVLEYRYRERFHLSRLQFESEPEEAVNEFIFMAQLEAARAKLEEDRQKAQNNN
jgi:hypothetical protein